MKDSHTPSADRVQRSVAALGNGQAPAFGCDGAALDAVCVVDDHVDEAGFAPAHLPGIRILWDLVDAGRAHPFPGFGDLARDVGLDADVVGGVVTGRVAGDVDG